MDKAFIVKGFKPLSQNWRPSAKLEEQRNAVIDAHNKKFKTRIWSYKSGKYDTRTLMTKVFYFHKELDKKDADNISKPMWDSLNEVAYKDDKQIIYLETLKFTCVPGKMKSLDIDCTDMDDSDYEDILNFLLDGKSTPSNDYLLYMRIQEYNSQKIAF